MQQASKTEYRGGLHQRQKELILRWYDRLDMSAETGRPATVSMMISGNPVELLEGFGALPIYPEINALQLAIREPKQPLFNVAAPGFRQIQLLGKPGPPIR